MENKCSAKSAQQMKKKMWFAFGQSHVHNVNGFVFDKDIVVEIEAEDPRRLMFEMFGVKWSMQYKEKPDMSLFPRGIKQL